MAQRRPPVPVLIVVGVVHLTFAVLVWRDLSRRRPGEIRGPKALWRTSSAANASGSLAYVLFGRRPRRRPETSLG